MTARVFAFDPAVFANAEEAVDVAQRIVEESPADVIRAVSQILKNDGAGCDGLLRATVVAHVAGCLAGAMEAVHDVLSTRALERTRPWSSAPPGIHGIGQLCLALVEGDRPVRALAVLDADHYDWFLREGLDLTPAFSALGARPLPLRPTAFEAVSLGETTLAIADSVLAAIPQDLIARAAGWHGSAERGSRVLGRRLYESLFPGRRLLLGEDVLWRDAVVLSSRAVTDFEEWRATMIAYQSAAGNDESLSILIQGVVLRLARAGVGV